LLQSIYADGPSNKVCTCAQDKGPSCFLSDSDSESETETLGIGMLYVWISVGKSVLACTVCQVPRAVFFSQLGSSLELGSGWLYSVIITFFLAAGIVAK
jgi:hypothetical protein